jgi:hypothetical protein
MIKRRRAGAHQATILAPLRICRAAKVAKGPCVPRCIFKRYCKLFPLDNMAINQQSNDKVLPSREKVHHRAAPASRPSQEKRSLR